MNKKYLYVALVIGIVIALILMWKISDSNSSESANNENQATQSNEQNQSISPPAPQKEENNSTVPKKQSNQSVSSDEEVDLRPIVTTGYGNSSSKPLSQGQQTSTTCTTNPGVDCYITFKSGQETVTFDAKRTDSQGVALWDWIGGQEVGSGEWEVTAKAGDLISLTGIVYIQ